MIYLKCPTCGFLLGNKQIPYEEKLKNICENNLGLLDSKHFMMLTAI